MAAAIFSPYKANDEGGVAYHRDASFSSYLDSGEREFVRSLADLTYSPSPARETSIPRKNVRKNVGRNVSRVERNGELDVFKADRYFNENINNNPLPGKDEDEGSNRHRHHRRDDGLLERKSSRSNTSNSRNSLKSPTPSLRSQGSFNSQIGLLLPKKGLVGHKIFSGFQCKGSCFDKKSVHTTNPHQMAQSTPKSSYQRNRNLHTKERLSHQKHFAFPIIDTATLSLEHDTNKSSKSLDVFGYHNLEKQEIVAQNFDTKFSILAWDAIPNSHINTPFSFPLRNKTSPFNVSKDEDVCSDTSSDLFEIENLSGILDVQTSNPYNEPSEGSIEWSIVTKSAADCEDDSKTSINIERRRSMHKSSTSGGFFLGCTNHKAVDVVGN